MRINILIYDYGINGALSHIEEKKFSNEKESNSQIQINLLFRKLHYDIYYKKKFYEENKNCLNILINKKENISFNNENQTTIKINKTYPTDNIKGNKEVKVIKEVNTIIENNNTYRAKRGDFKNLNSDSNLKAALSGTSGKFGKLLDTNCYKLVSVDTLIKEGFVEKVNDCNVATNANHSVIVVYAMGDSADPTGPGQLVAVSDEGLCS